MITNISPFQVVVMGGRVVVGVGVVVLGTPVVVGVGVVVLGTPVVVGGYRVL